MRYIAHLFMMLQLFVMRWKCRHQWRAMKHGFYHKNGKFIVAILESCEHCGTVRVGGLFQSYVYKFSDIKENFIPRTQQPGDETIMYFKVQVKDHDDWVTVHQDLLHRCIAEWYIAREQKLYPNKQFRVMTQLTCGWTVATGHM